MKKITARAADALDLMIEFSTLGEFGLEYPESDGSAPCRPGRPRKKPVARKSPPPPRIRPAGNRRSDRTRRKTCPATMATGLPEALMPPRIKLDPIL